MKWPKLEPDTTYKNSGWYTEALRHGCYKTCRRGAGDYLYRQDEPAEHVILITRGLVARVYDDPLIPDKGEIMIDIHGQGELIGISATLSERGTKYCDSARAHSESVGAIVFPAQWIRAHEANGASIVRSALQRSIQEHIAVALQSEPAWSTRMKFASVEIRLKTLLIELAQRFGRIDGATTGMVIDIGLNQQDLADLVGLSREHVSRICTALRKKGLLRAEHRSIVIPDLKKLEEAV